MAVTACQSFQFFRQINWFLIRNISLSKFMYRILHYLISLSNDKKLVRQNEFLLPCELTQQQN